MRFHSPLDDVQWSAAVKAHRQMRAHLRELRRAHRLRNTEESELLKQYREVIQEFGKELVKKLFQNLQAFVVYVRIRASSD